MARTGFSRKFPNIAPYICIYIYIYIYMLKKIIAYLFPNSPEDKKSFRIFLSGYSPRLIPKTSSFFFCVRVCFLFLICSRLKVFYFSFSTKTFIKLECFLAPKTIILEHGPNNWPNWDQNEFRLARHAGIEEGLGAEMKDLAQMIALRWLCWNLIMCGMRGGQSETVFNLSVCPSVRPSVCLSVRLS